MKKENPFFRWHSFRIWCFTLNRRIARPTMECGSVAIRQITAYPNWMQAVLEWRKRQWRQWMNWIFLAHAVDQRRWFMYSPMRHKNVKQFCNQCSRGNRIPRNLTVVYCQLSVSLRLPLTNRRSFNSLAIQLRKNFRDAMDVNVFYVTVIVHRRRIRIGSLLDIFSIFSSSFFLFYYFSSSPSILEWKLVRKFFLNIFANNFILKIQKIIEFLSRLRFQCL